MTHPLIEQTARSFVNYKGHNYDAVEQAQDLSVLMFEHAADRVDFVNRVRELLRTPREDWEAASSITQSMPSRRREND